MANTSDTLPKPVPRFGAWTTWVTVAFVAIVAGLLLPQLLPGESSGDKSPSKLEVKTKPGGDYTAPAVPDVPSPQAMLGRLLLGTIFVLGLAVVSLWGARRWMQPNGPANAIPREMRLIETLPLGNRCSVYLVHLGKREILIGVDGTGIKTVVPLASSFEDALADAVGSRQKAEGSRQSAEGSDQESPDQIQDPA